MTNLVDGSIVPWELEQDLGRGLLPRPKGATGPYDYGMKMEAEKRGDCWWTRKRWHGVWYDWELLG